MTTGFGRRKGFYELSEKQWDERVKRKKKIRDARGMVRILLATMAAGFFAVLFLMPIVLTITNSFMAASEISANYGQVFATSDTGGKMFISEKVNLKFIPDIVSFSQYVTVLFKSPEYLFKFWNSVILVVPIVLFQLLVAAGASFGFTRYRGRVKEIIFFVYHIDADAVSGNVGAQLSCSPVAPYAGYQLGHMAAGYFFTFCGIPAHEIYAEDSGFGDGGGSD